MIAAVEQKAITAVEASATPRRRKRRRPQVEVRVVVELQMPEWLQQRQAGQFTGGLTPPRSPIISPACADPSRGFTEVASPMPTQEVFGFAHVLTQDLDQSAMTVTGSSGQVQTQEPGPELRSQNCDMDSAERSTGGLTPPRSPEQDVGDSETLLALYDRCVREKRSRSAGKRAISEHRMSCRSFDKFCESQKALRCTTPLVSFLKSPELMHAYAHWSMVENDKARTTTVKRIDHICMVVKHCFQLELDCPSKKELKLIDDSKQNVKRPLDGRRIPSFDEVDALAKSVAGLQWPYKSHAPYFWRGLIRFASLIGFRTYDVVSLVPEKPGLCKQDVIWETPCPIADVNNALGYVLHSPHGWLHYVIAKDTGSDCRRILIPMPSWLRDWVRFFFELSSHPEKIFPSMQQGSLDAKAFGRAWKKIVTKAEVDPRLKISEGSGDVIAIRKYAANWWTLATLRHKNDASMADKMSHYILHHTEATTATRHYLSVQATILPVMLELLPSWPVPAADAPHVSLLPE